MFIITIKIFYINPTTIFEMLINFDSGYLPPDTK